MSLHANWLNAYHLMRVHRPIGFLLLLWPALMGLWIASNGLPPIKFIIIYILGAFIMRSAGCVINDLADKNFDKHVARTKLRPLASNATSVSFAIKLFIGLLALSLVLFFQLNIYAKMHALIALCLACFYPFTKRFLHTPQLVLGVSFAWSIPMAFAQFKGSVNYFECWLLFSSMVFWVIAYDTQYALNDLNDDLKIGIKSSAIFFGQYVKQIILVLQFIALILFMSLGFVQKYFYIFFIGAVMTVGFFIQQHLLIKKQHYLQAFNKNNLLGLSWLVLIILAQSFN